MSQRATGKAVVLLAAALLLAVALTACGSLSATPAANAELTKTFSSQALGVSFHYPASWHLTSVSAKDGFVGVVSPGSDAVAAGVGVNVHFQRASKAARPLAFAGVTNEEVSDARSAYSGMLPGTTNLPAGPQTVGGLRLMEDEYLQSFGGVQWHRLSLRSSQLTLASNLDIEGQYRVSQASSEGPIVTAIIASMRFSQPKG